MEKKKSVNFMFIIIAAIVGSALYKQFNFDTFKFENIALSIIYAGTFLFAIYFLVKEYNKKVEK